MKKNQLPPSLSSRAPRVSAPSRARSISAVLAIVALAVAVLAGYHAWRPTPASASRGSQPAARSGASGADESASPSGGPTSELPTAISVVGAPEPTGTLRLEGQVIDADELPVAGAVVYVATNPPRTLHTEGDGIFKFDGLVAKHYQVVARKGVWAAGPIGVDLTRESGPLTLRMRKASSVEVAVVADRERAPIAKASLRIEDLPELVAATDDEGKATLSGVPDGLHFLRVTAHGYAPYATSVRVATGATGVTRVDVRLARGASVAGRVLDAHGEPVAGAAVRVQSVAPQASIVPAFSDVVRTGAGGEFAFEAVGPGRQRVVADHDTHGTGSSDALDLDGTTAVQKLEIRLSEGASIAGTVVTTSGAPVSFAQVRVVREDEGAGLHGGRQVYADEHGAFRANGLAAARLRVFAMRGTSASDAVLVDATRATTPITLVVDADGTIDGVVVTANGEPASDVQVTGVAERGGERSGARAVDDPLLTGFASATTDVSGRFTLRGLHGGSYRLRTGRGATTSTAFWLRRATVATTGAKAVRLVLDADAVLKGRLAYEDGSTPDQYMVAITSSPAVPFTDPSGRFALDDVPAGTHAITISGPDVAPKFLDDVQLAPGQELDLGTIQVGRPRTVRGHVKRADGAPIAGATIHVGGMLFGAGSQIATATGLGTSDEAYEVISASDGTFALKGMAKVPLVAVAESPRDGRSRATPVPAEGDAPIELVVQPTAALHGTVTRSGRAVPHAYVVATTREANRARVVVEADEQGAYRFDALAAGAYVVSAAVTQGVAVSTKGTEEITLDPGGDVSRDLRIPGGDVTLTVSVVERASGGPVPNGLAYLVSGTVRATRNGELETALTNAGAGSSFMTSITRGGPATFQGVEAGSYSLCVVGMFANLDSPAAVARIQREAAKLPVACVPLDVPASPAQQARTVMVP